MADVTQSGTIDVGVTLNTGAVTTAPFPICAAASATEKQQTVRFAVPIIHNNYLYICITGDYSDNSYYAVQRIRRLNLSDPFALWETISDGIWPSSGGIQGYCSYVGAYGTKFFLVGTRYDNLSGGGNSNGYAAVFDVSNIGAGWIDVAITNRPDTTDEQGVSACVANDGVNLILTAIRSNNTGGYYKNNIFSLPANNLTAAWDTTKTAPVWFSYQSTVTYNGEIYFFGGDKASFSTYNSYPSSEVLKYNSTTNVWTRNVITPPPFVNYFQATTVLAGSKVYIIQKDVNACHYYDLASGSASEWVSVPLPNSPANGYGALAFDSVNSRLIYVDATTGAVETLRLDSSLRPLDYAWTLEGMNHGYTEIIENPAAATPDTQFDITPACLDIIQTVGVDTTFTFESYGELITAHTGTYTNPTQFSITAAGEGVTNIAQLGATNAPFSITEEIQELPPYSPPIAFSIESEAEGIYAAGVGVVEVDFEAAGTGAVAAVITGAGASDFRADLIASGFTNIAAAGAGVFVLDAEGTGFVHVRGVPQDIDIDFISSGSGVAAVNVTGVGATAFDLKSEGTGGSLLDPSNSGVNAWIVNLETTGHGCYTGYGFNSYFRLGNDLFGCSGRGLDRLSGRTDNGTAIATDLITGDLDFNTNLMKRLDCVRTTARTDGELTLAVTMDEQEAVEDLPQLPDATPGYHARRTKIPRKLRGTVCRVRLKNKAGCMLDLSHLELEPILSRRTEW